MTRVIFVAVREPRYAVPGYFKPGDLVLDPFGYIPDQAGVTVIRIGRK